MTLSPLVQFTEFCENHTKHLVNRQRERKGKLDESITLFSHPYTTGSIALTV